MGLDDNASLTKCGERLPSVVLAHQSANNYQSALVLPPCSLFSGEICVNELCIVMHDDPRWQMFLEKYGISAEQLADLNIRVKLPN